MAKIEIFKYVENAEVIPAGFTIFKEGDSGKHMYVFQEGEADIIVNGQVVETIGSGSIVGEMALIDPSP
jgi:CRP-like cAMP-binding protein